MNNSSLFDEKTFYKQFIQDLHSAKTEVIIESPFMTSYRMKMLLPVLTSLKNKGVKIYLFTRDPLEHSETMEIQSESEIQKCENLGIQVYLCKGNHHRKLACIDRTTLWEGSLNILSQHKSREIMRRTYDKLIANEMLNFLQLKRFLC